MLYHDKQPFFVLFLLVLINLNGKHLCHVESSQKHYLLCLQMYVSMQA